MTTAMVLSHLGSSLMNQANMKDRMYPMGPVMTAITNVLAKVGT